MDVTLASDSDPPTGPLTTVTAANLAAVRQRVGQAALLAGVHPDRANLFTVAVNEIIINAIEHGEGPVTVAVNVTGGAVSVDVRDRGAGLVATTVPAELPPPDQLHGRGLWLANRLCDTLIFDHSATGMLVRLGINA